MFKCNRLIQLSMKVVAVNGSARANGNTHQALEIMAEVFQKFEIETEIIDLVNYNLHPFSFKKEEMEDDMRTLTQKVLDAEGLILGSPTYYSNVTSRMQMFIERLGSSSTKSSLKGKVGAAVAIARRQGANFVYAAMHYFFGIHQMPIATSTYWNNVIAQKPGDIEKDLEGIRTLRNLATNMAEMMLKLHA